LKLFVTESALSAGLAVFLTLPLFIQQSSGSDVVPRAELVDVWRLGKSSQYLVDRFDAEGVVVCSHFGNGLGASWLMWPVQMQQPISSRRQWYLWQVGQ
jgi:hypothetical protein